MPQTDLNVQFPWRDTRFLRANSGTTKFTESRLRSQLQTPIYWIKPQGGRKILWNFRLVRDWLINGESESHRVLVEVYLQSLKDPVIDLEARRFAEVK